MARRRSIALAALLTLVIVVGFGAYTLYRHTLGAPDAAPAPTGTDFASSATRAAAIGQWSVGTGLDVHLTSDLGPFQSSMNTFIGSVRTERANLEALVPTTQGPRAATLQSAIDATIRLESGMAQWRDTIFAMRLANVDAVQATVESAANDLRQAVDTWNSQSG